MPSHAPGWVAPAGVQPGAGPHGIDGPAEAAQVVVSVPSHAVPAQGSLGEGLGHAERPPCGAPTTGAQVPTVPGLSQAWHCPVHGWLQHTPSTQLPLRQSVDAVQCWLFWPSGTQWPAMQ
jgi:hypothetical protein